jgi:hypothetical protein
MTDNRVWILINKLAGKSDWIVGVFRTERAARSKMLDRMRRGDRPDVGTYEIECHYIDTAWVGDKYE